MEESQQPVPVTPLVSPQSALEPAPPTSSKSNLPLVSGLSILLIVVGSMIYVLISKSQQNKTTNLSNTSEPSPTTRIPEAKNSDWKTYDISECLVSFQYPLEWEGYLLSKENCTVHYSRPPVGTEPMDTFVVFDIQPENFMGEKNIEVDQNKVINRSTENGIEKTIEYSEEKDISRPLFLANKVYAFKKGPIYFRIIAQYPKGDKPFEEILDKVAGSTAIKGDDVFYEQYFQNLEVKLGGAMPESK